MYAWAIGPNAKLRETSASFCCNGQTNLYPKVRKQREGRRRREMMDVPSPRSIALSTGWLDPSCVSERFVFFGFAKLKPYKSR
jgi:hypothetical protein